MVVVGGGDGRIVGLGQGQGLETPFVESVAVGCVVDVADVGVAGFADERLILGCFSRCFFCGGLGLEKG